MLIAPAIVSFEAPEPCRKLELVLKSPRAWDVLVWGQGSSKDLCIPWVTDSYVYFFFCCDISSILVSPCPELSIDVKVLFLWIYCLGFLLFFFVMTYSLLFSKTCPRFPVLVWYKTQFVQYCPTQFWGPTRRQRQLLSPICSCGMPEHDKDVPMGVWKYIKLDQLNCGRFLLETMLAGKIPSFNLLKYFFAVGRRAHTVKELGSTYRCALTSVFPLMGSHKVEKQMSLGN